MDQDNGSPTTGAGDVLVAGQATLFRSRYGKLELDVGIELTLPTGSTSLLAGS